MYQYYFIGVAAFRRPSDGPVFTTGCLRTLNIELLPVVPPSDCRGCCCCCFCSQTGIPVCWCLAEPVPDRPRSTEAQSGPLSAQAADSTVRSSGVSGYDGLMAVATRWLRARAGPEGEEVGEWVKLQSDWLKFESSLHQCCPTQDPHHPIGRRSQEH